MSVLCSIKHGWKLQVWQFSTGIDHPIEDDPLKHHFTGPISCAFYVSQKKEKSQNYFRVHLRVHFGCFWTYLLHKSPRSQWVKKSTSGAWIGVARRRWVSDLALPQLEPVARPARGELRQGWTVWTLLQQMWVSTEKKTEFPTVSPQKKKTFGQVWDVFQAHMRMGEIRFGTRWGFFSPDSQAEVKGFCSLR